MDRLVDRSIESLLVHVAAIFGPWSLVLMFLVSLSCACVS